MERREFLKLSALAGAGLSLLPAFCLGPTALGVGATVHPGERCHPMGAHAQPRGTHETGTALTDLETMIGRKLAISRHYTMWDSVIPGQLPHTQLASRSHSVRRLACREDGRHPGNLVVDRFRGPGSDDPLARSRSRRGGRCISASTTNRRMTPVAERRRPSSHHTCAHRVGAEGVTNLTWVVTQMATTYSGGHGGATAWLPSTYDLVGVDGYNRANCYSTRGEARGRSRRCSRPRTTRRWPQEWVCSSARTVCVEHGTDPDAKAKWFVHAQTTIRRGRLEATLYSHSWSDQNGLAYWVDTSAASIASFRAVGLDPYFA